MESRDDVRFWVGLWSIGKECENTSNWKEFKNVVTTLKAEGEKHNLNTVSMYFLTDITRVESFLYKGGSGSKKLDALVLMFKLLEVKYKE